MAGFFSKIFSAIKGFFTGNKPTAQRTPQQSSQSTVHHHVSDPESLLLGPKIRTRIGMAQWTTSGHWATVQSSYVHAIRYDLNAHELYVRFSNAVCRYPNITPELAQQMFHSASMGRFVRSMLYHRPYTKV